MKDIKIKFEKEILEKGRLEKVESGKEDLKKI